MKVEVDDKLLDNETDICVTDAHWVVQGTQVFAADTDGKTVCIVCEVFGEELARCVANEHNSSLGGNFLRSKFIQAMNDIGRYGAEKYGKESFHLRAEAGNLERDDRTSSESIANHAAEHFNMYMNGVLHDRFGTKRHQLAAVAFNAMMEFYFAGLEEE